MNLESFLVIWLVLVTRSVFTVISAHLSIDGNGNLRNLNLILVPIPLETECRF